MKKLIWFIAGIGLGVATAQQLRENPKAKDLADDVARRAKEFGAAVSDGFREREAEIAAEAAKQTN